MPIIIIDYLPELEGQLVRTVLEVQLTAGTAVRLHWAAGIGEI